MLAARNIFSISLNQKASVADELRSVLDDGAHFVGLAVDDLNVGIEF